ncbi:uncharacterized protein [Lepeophtheirus salmonis]|uniref:uncharacterized protein isoform X2 n=1 Tax=Lepeophtheirus salmonis TaxID=72036 RepID=UPI001AE5E464|nr:uncharacterized protein LOC121127836 isoform X2 [Lepeophtheirus salmonis]
MSFNHTGSSTALGHDISFDHQLMGGSAVRVLFKMLTNVLPKEYGIHKSGTSKLFMNTDLSDEIYNWNRIFLYLPFIGNISRFYIGDWSVENQNITWCEASPPIQESLFENENDFPACSFAFNRFFYLVGGKFGVSASTIILRYDYYKNKWEIDGQVPGEPRVEASCTAFHGSILISGGKSVETGEILQDIHHRHVNTLKWNSPIKIIRLQRPLYKHALVVMGDGMEQRIVSAFGKTTNSTNPYVEEYIYQIKGGWSRSSMIQNPQEEFTYVVIPYDFIKGCPIQSSSHSRQLYFLLLISCFVIVLGYI